MKYKMKDYPEYKEAVGKMSIDELLLAVICPSMGETSEPVTNTESVFIGKSPRAIFDKQVEAINGGREFPALLVADMEFGAGDSVDGAVRFPSFRAAAQSKSEELCYAMGKVAALESLEAGYHWTFGPCVDILGNHRSPIVSYRTAGDDADTVIKYGGAYMRGLQDNGLIATIKHFPGDGYCTDDQHVTMPDNPLSREEWDASFGRVYESLINDGVMAIMPGHIALPSYDEIDPETGFSPPASASKNLPGGILRERFGFEGIIVSDAVTMNGFAGYVNLYHASARFLEAGGDVLLFMPNDEDYLCGMKREIELGKVGAFSFEGYIAPGANTPYACFMYTPESGHASVFNTTYPTFENRPMDPRTPNRKFRFQSEYVDGESRHYLFFSWENWMQRIPQDGSVWDFENMCWHRAGNSCWNGTESIHGRSTWGEFEFRLTPQQRARILKPLLAAAYREYKAEKRCAAGHDGALVHWADAATGDPEFHAAQVQPLIETLDKYGKLIASDMNDDTVLWLAKEALPKWQDVLFEVERRRAAWLLERNAK